MIKLKSPLNYKGTLHEAGAVVTVAPEFGDKLVAAGLADQCITGPEVVPKEEKDSVLKQLEEAQRIANEKTDEALKLIGEKERAESGARVSEQALSQAQTDIKTLQETLEKEQEQAAKKIVELEEALIETKKQLSEAQASSGLVGEEPQTKSAKKGGK